MRTICFYFQVHQPYRLRRYRFFDIGTDHSYYDNYSNRSIMRKVSEKCYLPANEVLLNLVREFGCRFKISFSISGTALDQFEEFAPEVLESFQRLAQTGCVEFLSETYSHSLSSLRNKDEFFEQVRLHREKIEALFGIQPKVFRNTELIYSDTIGEMVQEMGFEGMLTEGAKHVLGWKSPNFLYCNAINPKLKVLLKNFKLSDDIAFRFSNRGWSEWPLTAEKFVEWIKAIDKKEDIINLFMDYETFGEHQWADTGIFDFMKSLPEKVFSMTDFTFSTPGEIINNYDPVSAVHIPYPVSWADEERDLTAWLGNELQDDAFRHLYKLSEKVRKINNPGLLRDWRYLQTSDHFYYMCTKWFSDGDVHKYFNPYDTPYEAFINYMNILSDFEIRLDEEIKDLDVEIGEEVVIKNVKPGIPVITKTIKEPHPEKSKKKSKKKSKDEEKNKKSQKKQKKIKKK